MNNYTSVSFKTSKEQTAIITAMLMDMGYEGVEEKDDETMAFIAEKDFDEDELKTIFEKFDVEYSLKSIEQQNWNASWESSFEPVLVNDFAVIRAAFHTPIPGVVHDIIITPKMSFGTGHHATTFLMIQEMGLLNFKDKSVIDFGTGTGVLAILAEKMGAKEILAIDNDEWSINNAKENIAANNCNKIVLQKEDEMIADKKVAIILANINLNVIIANITRIKEACFSETNILLSGLLIQDKKQITDVLSKNGFKILKYINKNNWMAILTKMQ